MNDSIPLLAGHSRPAPVSPHNSTVIPGSLPWERRVTIDGAEHRLIPGTSGIDDMNGSSRRYKQDADF